jgi:hypothetical protein
MKLLWKKSLIFRLILGLLFSSQVRFMSSSEKRNIASGTGVQTNTSVEKEMNKLS